MRLPGFQQDLTPEPENPPTHPPKNPLPPGPQHFAPGTDRAYGSPSRVRPGAALKPPHGALPVRDTRPRPGPARLASFTSPPLVPVLLPPQEPRLTPHSLPTVPSGRARRDPQAGGGPSPRNGGGGRSLSADLWRRRRRSCCSRRRRRFLPPGAAASRVRVHVCAPQRPFPLPARAHHNTAPSAWLLRLLSRAPSVDAGVCGHALRSHLSNAHAPSNLWALLCAVGCARLGRPVAPSRPLACQGLVTTSSRHHALREPRRRQLSLACRPRRLRQSPLLLEGKQQV